jgi:hypothetical protein
MKFKTCHLQRPPTNAHGFTLVEMMTSVGLGVVLLCVVAILFINGSMSFVAVANYQNLDAKSTVALDTISKEIRNATAVIATNSVSLTLTNASAATFTKLTYNSTARTLVMTKTGQAAVTNLTGCDSWSFALYNRVPTPSSTNITFTTAGSLAEIKLISMTWKCSRTVLGSRMNTESVQTAQVVLRNKVN